MGQAGCKCSVDTEPPVTCMDALRKGMQYFLAQNQINGEALGHWPKSPRMSIPIQAGSASPNRCIEKLQKKLVPNSLVSLRPSWLWGQRVGGRVKPRPALGHL